MCAGDGWGREGRDWRGAPPAVAAQSHGAGGGGGAAPQRALASVALDFDIVIAGKPGFHAAIQGEASPDALAIPTFKGSFKTLTDWTIHNFPLRLLGRPAIAATELLYRCRS